LKDWRLDGRRTLPGFFLFAAGRCAKIQERTGKKKIKRTHDVTKLPTIGKPATTCSQHAKVKWAGCLLVSVSVSETENENQVGAAKRKDLLSRIRNVLLSAKKGFRPSQKVK